MDDDDDMRPVYALLAGTLLAGLAACSSGTSVTSAAPVALHGPEPSPVPPRPAYVLTDTTGARYDFGARTRGHPTYVYFGYTHCPDECPTAMADLALVLRKVSPELRARTRVVFVTTDPARDTAPVLRRWLDQFSTSFVGLLGSPAEVGAAERASGVPVARPDGPIPTIAGHPDRHATEAGTAPHQHVGALGYAVAHSALIYAYDAANRLPVVYPGGVTPSEIAADLPILAHPAGSTK